MSETVYIIPYQYYYGSFWKMLQCLLFSQLKRMHVYVRYASFSSRVVEIYLFLKPLDLMILSGVLKAETLCLYA